jgi:glycine/D-amino acid oxidase-like deaminating enzyme
MQQPEHFDSIVIGDGLAGLSVGYHLAQQGIRFVILDANERISEAIGYCSGGWDEALRSRHAAKAPMIRP